MSGELRLYDVTVGKHKTQMRLNDADAVALGAVLADQPAEPKAVRAAEPDTDGKSRLVTSNKMRGTEPGSHKGREAL
jgi:hypothetical protein